MTTENQAPEGALTPEQLADKCEAWLQAGGASNIVDAYEAGYREAERAALAAQPAAVKESLTVEGGPDLRAALAAQQSQFCPICEARGRAVQAPAEGDAALRRLIASWREGTEDREGKSGYDRGVDFAFVKAANDLEAALAASNVQPKGSDKANEWRKLAQQFDGQRMAAMVHLRTLLAMPTAHAEAARAFLAATPAEQIASVGPVQAPAVKAEPSPTAGMTTAQRILHVGGRNNAAGYVEFGSTQAVEALIRQVLRDLPTQAPSEWRKAVQEAYGWLWHINNEPMAPVPLLSEGKAAYQARKALRELLTSAERGEAINAVSATIDNIAASKPPVQGSANG